MSSTGDKIKGYANEAVGSVKATVGKVTGSTQTEIEGEAQKIKGEAQVAVGKTFDLVACAAHFEISWFHVDHRRWEENAVRADWFREASLLLALVGTLC